MKNKLLPGMPSARRQIQFPHPIAVALIAGVTIVAAAGCSPEPGSNPPQASATAQDVTLTAAQREHLQLYAMAPSNFRRTIETTGTVDYDHDQAASVLAPFSGPVTRLLVSAGQQVKKGEALAAVNSPDFATAISTYRKALASARTARRLAELERDLILHHGVAQREADQAETEAANADADRDAALQALVSLNVAPRIIEDIQDGRPVSRLEGVIRSPIAGTVTEKLISPGELLQAGSTPCFTIADLSRVWVKAQIFGSDIASVGVGDPADVVTGIGAKNFSGTVANISAVVDPDTRSVIARVVVKNPGGFLKKQMYVRVLIHAREESSGLLAPVSAILRDDENLPFVYVAEAAGGFARRHVTLGYRTGNRYEIVDGLRAGDRVVVDGGIFVQFIQNQ